LRTPIKSRFRRPAGLPPTVRQRRLVLVACIVLLGVFAALAPFATAPLQHRHLGALGRR
jgi:hypothetical protein